MKFACCHGQRLAHRRLAIALALSVGLHFFVFWVEPVGVGLSRRPANANSAHLYGSIITAGTSLPETSIKDLEKSQHAIEAPPQHKTAPQDDSSDGNTSSTTPDTEKTIGFFHKSLLTVPPELISEPESLAHIDSDWHGKFAIRLFISATGNVIAVEHLSDRAPEELKAAVSATFLATRFRPGEIGKEQVPSQLVIELELLPPPKGSSQATDQRGWSNYRYQIDRTAAQ